MSQPDTLSFVNDNVEIKITVVDEDTQDLSLDIEHKHYTSRGFALSNMRLHLTPQDLSRLSDYIYDVQQKLAIEKLNPPKTPVINPADLVSPGPGEQEFMKLLQKKN